MKSLMLPMLIIIAMNGCTNKCKPSVEFIEQKYPVMETVDINKTIEIPSYRIPRADIAIDDSNVTMSIDTFRKIKDGDALKVRYLMNRLKVWMFGVEVLNEQVRRFNREFVDGKK